MTKHEELRRLATLLLDESHMNALSLSAMRDQSHDYQRATRPTVILELLADLERKDALLRKACEVLKAEYANEYDEALELAVLAAIEKELT